MAIQVKLKKEYVYYGITKKVGETMDVTEDQIPRLLKKGFIEDPFKTKDEKKEIKSAEVNNG